MNFSKIINTLRPFTFNTNNIHKLLVYQTNDIEKSIKKSTVIKKAIDNINQNEFFIPKEKDFLFWCWIIFLYGFSEYEILKKNTFITEKNYKINFIDKLRNKENKPILKKLKTKLTDIEGNLANESILTLKNLETMLIIDKFNFIYINDKIYYENITYPGNKICVIKHLIKIRIWVIIRN